ncbi:MAG TPA: choice-of-anchor V domain-containing protein [Bacteroidia bacterium]|nr:choice-of-anchor V domain-containing protein [Bacteroidia bacterium]
MNKTKIAVLLAVTVSAVATMSFDILDDTGKAGRTGSPGESTCTGCHTGSVINDGVGSVVISSPDLGINWEYMVGDTYTINVTVSRPAAPLFGFDLEALTSAAQPQNGGTLIVTNTNETHILNATVMTVVRKNMTHKLNGGLGTGTKTFSFKWAAPTTNVGNVTFYCTGNATNNNGAKTGDHIYSTSQIVTPALGSGTLETETAPLDFIMFPNPANENIFVTYSAPAGEQVNFSLVTIDGKEVNPVYTFRGTGATETSSLVLPADLAAGIYLVRMESGEKVSVKRVVVE